MSDIRLDIDGSERHAARRRALARLLLVMLLLVVIGVIALPRLLSTGVGNGVLLSWINHRIAGEVSLDSASVGWFGGSEIRGLTLKDPQGGAVVAGLDLDAPDTGFAGLLHAWWRQDASGIDTAVRVAEMDLMPAGSGGLNLSRSLARPAATPSASDGDAGAEPWTGRSTGWRDTVGWTGSGVRTPPAAEMDLRIERLRWRARPGATVFEVSGLEAVVDARDPDHIQASMAAETRRGDDVGRVFGEFALLGSSTPGGELILREATLQASGRLQGFPVAVLSEAGWAEEWTRAALGATADVSLDASGTLAAPEVDLQVSSETLQANLKLEDDGAGVSAVSGSGLDWTLTPAAFAAVAKGRGWTLQEDVNVRLDVETLRITEGASGAQPEWASVLVGGSIGTVHLQGPDEKLSLEGGRVRLTSEALGRRADFTLAATVHDAEGAAPMRLAALVQNIRMPEEAGPPSLMIELVGLPTELFGLAGPRGVEAARLLGPELAFRLEAVQRSPGTRLRLRPDVVTAEVSFTSEGLSGPAAIRFEERGRTGSLNTPEPLRFRIRDESLGEEGLLGSLAQVRLDEPMDATLDLRELRWRLLADGEEQPPALIGGFASHFAWLQQFDAEGTSLSAALRIEEARLRGRRGGVVGLDDVVVDVAAERLGGEPEVFLDGLVVPAEVRTVVQEPGTLRGRLRIGGLLDNRGRIRPGGVTLRGEGGGGSLPSETLDRLLAGDGRLPALLGPVFNPNLTLDAGPGHPPRFAATLDSENAVAGLSAELKVDHLELGAGGRFQIGITEAGADALRGRLHPISNDLIRGVPGYPLVLEPRGGGIIRPEAGWAGWLALLDGATLRPGRLELSGNGWMLEALAACVRQRVPGFRHSFGRQIEVETTPVTVHLEGGRLSHGPLWMYAPELVLGLRGWSDASAANDPAAEDTSATEPADESRIDMVLGIPGAVLQEQIPGTDMMEAGAVYEVQVGGWVDNPIAGTDRFATDLLLSAGQSGMHGWVGSPEDWDVPAEVRVELEAMIPPADEGLLPSAAP